MKIVTKIFILFGTVVLFCINFLPQRQIRVIRNTFPYWTYTEKYGWTCINRTDKDWLLPSYYGDSMVVVHPGDTVPYGNDGTYKPWPYPDTITVVKDGYIYKAKEWRVPNDSSSAAYALIWCYNDTVEFSLFNLKGEHVKRWKDNLLTDSCIECETE